MDYLAAYISAGAAFLLLDLLWLGVIARNMYHRAMGTLLAERFNIAAAAAFYLIYLAGVLYFAIVPGLTEQSVVTAALHGALFGFFAYATYDLTALAVIRGFPGKLAIIDIIWGSFLTAAAATVGFYGPYLIALL